MKHYINRKTVEDNELLPSASYLTNWIVYEVDTGNVFMSNGTVTTKVQGSDKVETIKNKQVDVTDNSFINTNSLIDNPFITDQEVKGGVVPATTIPNSYYGILEGGVSLINPNKVVTNALNQNFASALCEFRTGDPDGIMGFVSTQPYFTRDLGFEVKTILKSISKQCFLGFSTLNTLDLHSPCVFIGFNQDTTNFTVFSSNGNYHQQVPFSLSKDVLEHTFEIILKSDSIICKLDAQQITITNSRIPSLTDQLYLHCYGIV